MMQQQPKTCNNLSIDHAHVCLNKINVKFKTFTHVNRNSNQRVTRVNIYIYIYTYTCISITKSIKLSMWLSGKHVLINPRSCALVYVLIKPSFLCPCIACWRKVAGRQGNGDRGSQLHPSRPGAITHAVVDSNY
jgi:hypothetical protein